MITLLLMFLACESNKAETTNTTDNNTPEQVETTETPKATEVQETPVANDSKTVEVKTAENKETTISTTETTNAGENNATND